MNRLAVCALPLLVTLSLACSSETEPRNEPVTPGSTADALVASDLCGSGGHDDHDLLSPTSDPACVYYCHHCASGSPGATGSLIATILEGENAIIEAAAAAGGSHAGIPGLACLHGVAAGGATVGAHCAEEGPECLADAQNLAHIACTIASCITAAGGGAVPGSAAISAACAAGTGLASLIRCRAERDACEHAHRVAEPIDLEPCETPFHSVGACAPDGGPRPLIDIQNDCVRVVTGDARVPPLQQGTCSASCVENTQSASESCSGAESGYDVEPEPEEDPPYDEYDMP